MSSFKLPNVIGDARFHHCSNTQALVNPAEIAVHVVNHDGVFVILAFLRRHLSAG
jgi:hypothetical protein